MRRFSCNMAVALLAEGVDRNNRKQIVQYKDLVALLAEGVDRNMRAAIMSLYLPRRPPRGGRG